MIGPLGQKIRNFAMVGEIMRLNFHKLVFKISLVCTGCLREELTAL